MTDEVIWAGTQQTLTGAATGGKVGGARYRLTAERLHFERGTLSTDAQQVPIADVIDVDLKQTMVQRARGLADLVVHVQTPRGPEYVKIEAIPDARNVLQLINDTARAARLAAQQRQNTHTYNGGGPTPAAPAPAPVATTPDVMQQLRSLGELHAQGFVSDDEFNRKKAELLARL